MFPLRRDQIHMLKKLIASQLGCQIVPKPGDMKGFIFSHTPASLTLSISVNDTTIIQSLEAETQVSSGYLPLPHIYFSQSPGLLSLYLLHVSHVIPCFPIPITIRLVYTLIIPCLDHCNILCVHYQFPHHTPPTLMPPELSFQNKNQTKLIHDRYPSNLHVLCGIFMFTKN